MTGADAPQEGFSGEIQHVSFSEIEGWLTAARPRLHRLAQSRGIARDAIEDVVQETLLEAWRHLDRLHTPTGFPAWLDEICRNICRRHARKQWMEQQHMLPLLTPYQHDDGGSEEAESSLLMNIPDTHLLDPLEALDQQDAALLLDRALGSLSRNAREVVELCYLGELPQREVALRLGLSLSAVEARLHRARHQLRQALNGPLRKDAEALGLALNQDRADGWQETRLWCSLCGRHRLEGMFLPQPNGSTNLHMRCPDCEQHYGLSDIHNSNVHSKGLIPLDGLQSFRPAWKRTMQGMTRRFTQALLSDKRSCPYCGVSASLRLMDKIQMEEISAGTVLPASLSRRPYQFWICWRCPRCQCGSNDSVGVFAASDLVYWSHDRTQQFMAEHPHWVSEPELLVEYAGQPALRFQMADITSTARLTVLAHRQTLQVFAVF